MEVTFGKVVDGKVVVDGRPLEEGSTVAVVIRGEDTFTASEDQETELLEAIAQVQRGEVVDGWDLLKQVQSHR